MTETERAADALQHIDAGCPRDEWVRAGMGAKSAGLDFDDFHSWSQGAGNYAGENECRTVWKSFDDAGAVTPATLFAMAFSQGWKDPSKARTKGSNRRPGVRVAKPSPSPARPVRQAANAYAAEIWERCVPATPADPYIYRKHGKPDGLRVYPASAPPLIIRGENVAGYLVAPCWSGAHLQTLQFIPPEKGDKLNLPGATFNDGFFTVGKIADRTYICEGIGQAWAINRATSAGAVCCFGASRMAKVARALRADYPAAHLVIVPDKGKESEAAAIAADVSGRFVSMLDSKPSNYDANDFAQEFGTGALSELLERTQAPAMRFTLLSGADLCNAPPMRWLVRGVLPMEGLAALYGASGSGKSFLMLDIGAAIAGDAGDWHGRRVTHAPVTYVCLEGEAGMVGRPAEPEVRPGAQHGQVWRRLDAGNHRGRTEIQSASRQKRPHAQFVVLAVAPVYPAYRPGAAPGLARAAAARVEPDLARQPVGPGPVIVAVFQRIGNGADARLARRVRGRPRDRP